MRPETMPAHARRGPGTTRSPTYGEREALTTHWSSRDCGYSRDGSSQYTPGGWTRGGFRGDSRGGHHGSRIPPRSQEHDRRNLGNFPRNSTRGGYRGAPRGAFRGGQRGGYRGAPRRYPHGRTSPPDDVRKRRRFSASPTDEPRKSYTPDRYDVLRGSTNSVANSRARPGLTLAERLGQPPAADSGRMQESNIRASRGLSGRWQDGDVLYAEPNMQGSSNETASINSSGAPSTAATIETVRPSTFNAGLWRPFGASTLASSGPPAPPPGPPPGPPPRPPSLSISSRSAAASPLVAISPCSSQDASPAPGASVLRSDEAYKIVRQVGAGTYGEVYKACARVSGALVALKRIRQDNAREGFPMTSMREMKLLQSLRHDNVIRLHETMTARGAVFMVFEYMEHDLHGLLVHGVTFSDAHRKSITKQLLRGLAYLHHRSVLHRDLKGSNLLLNNQGTLKIADFGLARTFYKRRMGDYTNRVVTLWYRPPELLLGATQYGSEVDAWGAGCLFLELFLRRAIFQGSDEIDQLHVIMRTLGPLTPVAWPGVMALPWFELLRLEDRGSYEPVSDAGATTLAARLPQLSPAALSLAHGLLHYDPSARLSATDALQHDYFTHEAPAPEQPAQVLHALHGEWHEMQSKHAHRRRHAT